MHKIFSNTEEFLKGLLDAIHDPMMVLDRDNNIVWANDSAKKYAGKDILGENCHNVLLGRNTACRNCIVRKSFDDGKSHEADREINDCKGNPHFFHCIANVVKKDAGGKPELVVEICQETTERKQAERKLKASMEFLNTVIDELPHPFAVKDENHRWILINKIICDYFQKPREEMIGKTDHDFIQKKEADIFRDIEKEVLRTGEPNINEEVVTTAEGKKHYQVAVKKRIEDGEGRKYILAMSVDITDTRLAEIEKQSLQQQLIQAQKMESIGMLAGGVAHEFNNLLSIIMANASYGLELMKNSKKPRKEFVNILNTSENAKKMISQLLVFAKKGMLDKRDVDVTDLIVTLQEIIGKTFPETIEITARLAEGIPRIEVDRNQILQALLNICNNARSAMDDHGRIEIRAKHIVVSESNFDVYGATQSGHYCMITISDSGPGIPAENREKIFEPFFTTKNVETGTGLGLSVTHGIIENHGGWIRVADGGGAVFEIFLPI